MRKVLAAFFLWLVVSEALAQRPAPAPALLTSTSTAPAGTTGALREQADACRKEISIYIDLSGTMKKPDPLQPNRRANPNRVPLNFIAETLGRFVTKAGLVQPDDIVSVKYFGSIVQTQATGKDAAAALLAKLAGPDTWRAAVSGLPQTDFERYTDFSRVFNDIRDHVNNSGAVRQIIFVASDYAEDPPAVGPPLDTNQRVEEFRKALAVVQPLLNSDRNVNGRVQLVGVFAPEPPAGLDHDVSRGTKAIASSAGMQLYQYNDDAVEAASTLQNYFVGSVTAVPREKTSVTIGTDNRIGFLVANPNCDDIVVAGLLFRGTAERMVEIPPLPLVNGTREVRIEVDALSSVWNQEVTVTPVLRNGTVARTEASPRFWLGDWVRVTQLAPYLYPWGGRAEGSTLVTATVTESIRSTASITIRNIDPGDRPRVFTITKEGLPRQMTLSFVLTPAQVPQLTSGQVSALIEGNNARLLSDTGAQTSLTVPLAAAVPCTTGTLIVVVQWCAFISIVLLAVGMLIRNFSRHEGLSTAGQFGAFGRALLQLVPGSIATALLSLEFGRMWGIDSTWVWLMVGVRALLVSYTTWTLLRALVVNGGWRIIERRFLPNHMAVHLRRVVSVVIAGLSIALFVIVWATFFWTPAASPNGNARVLSGASL
jgi:hypothetical protein